MRGLILLAVAALAAFTAAAVAQPAQIDHPGICPPLDREWRAVAGGRDFAAMDRVIARIPGACPNLRAEARRARAQAANQSLPPVVAPPREVATAPVQINPCDAADATWTSLRNSTDIARLQRFVRDTPASCTARAQAQARVTALQRPPAAQQQPTTTPPSQSATTTAPVGASPLPSGALPEMVRIPERNFEVGRYEVTFAQWDACVADGGCNGYRPNDNGWGRGTRPVINVSWNDAQAYVQWLSRRTGQRYRLLTEAEWEYAARAGTTTNFSWGDQDPVCDQNARNGANFRDCTDDRTRPVGSFQPNGFGLYDMHGNVWEWVEDCYDSSCSGRVLRGGSWIYGPLNLRSAYRGRYDPSSRGIDLGFRLARTV